MRSNKRTWRKPRHTSTNTVSAKPWMLFFVFLSVKRYSSVSTELFPVLMCSELFLGTLTPLRLTKTDNLHSDNTDTVSVQRVHRGSHQSSVSHGVTPTLPPPNLLYHCALPTSLNHPCLLLEPFAQRQKRAPNSWQWPQLSLWKRDKCLTL